MEKSLPAGDPRDPNRLLGYSYFISVIGSGILLAQNWRRLGKSEWTRNTVLLSIFVPVISLALMVGAILLLIQADAAASTYIVAFAAFGTNYGLVWSLARLQNGAYKKWKSGGPDALLAHEYNIQSAVNFALVIAALATVAGLILSIVQP